MKTLFRVTGGKRIASWLWGGLWIAEILLAARVLLKAIDVSPQSALASWIYAITQPLVSPFAFLFQMTDSGEFTLEWAAMLSMIGWMLLVIGILKLLRDNAAPEAVR